MNINLAPGMNEIIIREGAAPKVLDPKAPVKMNINGTIGAPVEFLKSVSTPDNSSRRIATSSLTARTSPSNLW